MRCSNTVSHLSWMLVDSLSEVFVLFYSLLISFFFKLGACDTAVLKYTVSPRILKLHIIFWKSKKERNWWDLTVVFLPFQIFFWFFFFSECHKHHQKRLEDIDLTDSSETCKQWFLKVILCSLCIFCSSEPDYQTILLNCSGLA